jgi:protein pelota
MCYPSRVQNVSSTGSTESHRVRLNLTLAVGRVDFSSSAAPTASASDSTNADQSGPSTQPTSAALHIAGRVTSENPHVKMGAFHTLDVEANRDVRIEKADGWDSVALARVEEAIIPGRGAEVGAVVCGEGTAAFCLLSQHMTLVANRISVHIPRKSAASGASQHEKGLVRFYATLYDTFLRHIPYGNIGLRAIVIASPGWVRDGVLDYMIGEATRRGDKVLQRALKEKVIKVHVTSPHVHSLVEVLKSPEVRYT